MLNVAVKEYQWRYQRVRTTPHAERFWRESQGGNPLSSSAIHPSFEWWIKRWAICKPSSRKWNIGGRRKPYCDRMQRQNQRHWIKEVQMIRKGRVNLKPQSRHPIFLFPSFSRCIIFCFFLYLYRVNKYALYIFKKILSHKFYHTLRLFTRHESSYDII